MTALAEADAGTDAPSAAVPTDAVPAVTGAGWLGLGAVVSKTCQTVALLVFAAVLAPDDFGLISLAAVLLNVSVVLGDLGTSTALVQLRGDAERAARTALTLALTVSLSLVVLVWLAAPSLADTLHLGADGSRVLRGIVLCLPLMAAAGVSAELLRRALDFRRRVLPDIVGNVLGAIVTVVALAAGSGAFALVIGQLAQASLVLLLLWLVRPPVLPGWRRDDARALLAFGGSLAGSGVLTLVVLNVDYVLIARRLGSHDVGIYSMAFRLAYMPYLLIALVVGGAVFAHLSRMRGAAVGRAAVDAAVLVHALVVPLYVGILVLAPQIALLGSQWTPAVPALRWLAGYGLLLSGLELVLVALKSVGRTADILALTGLHLVLLLGLLLAYVDRGVIAAAICQVVAGVLTLAVAGAVVTRRVGGIDGGLLLRRLGPVAAGAGALAGTAVVLQQMLPVGTASPVGLLVVGPVALLAYLLTVRLCDAGDRTGLARTLRLPPLPSRTPSANRPGRPGPADRRARGAGVPLLVGLGIVVLATAAGGLAVAAPVAALVALAAGAVLAAAAYRLEWAALLLVVTEPFGDLLREVHPATVKVVGLLLFASWMLRLATGPPGDRRGSHLPHPGLAALGVLVLVLLASVVGQGADLDAGRDHATTMLAYALVVVVLVHTIGRAPEVVARRLTTCFLLACTSAAVVALVGFLADGGRAAGPLSDPNDLAFFLVAALPFGLATSVATRGTTPAVTWCVLACCAVLVVTIFATFSRGALLALAAMLVVAVAIGAPRRGGLRRVVAVALVAVIALGAHWLTHEEVVEGSLAEKEHIAAANVDARLTTWTMAADMIADRPLLGHGPGGFEAAAAAYVPDDVGAVPQTVVHDMYLEVAVELGLPGLAAFLAVLGYAVRGAVRARAVPERRALADAVLLSFTGTLVAALFLSEQFYLPIWLLVALGIALDPGRAKTHRGGR